MVHDPSLFSVLGVAGELLPVDQDIIAAGDLGGDADLRQGPDHRAAEQGEVEGDAVLLICDEGEAEIAQVVIDGPAAGEPANHLNAVLPHIGGIDLLHRVLVLPHHDGVVILPEHEISKGTVQGIKDILLQGQVKGRVNAGTSDVFHPHGANPPLIEQNQYNLFQ